VPIIVLSTQEDPAIKSTAFACGANDYLVKLPDRIELVARVSSWEISVTGTLSATVRSHRETRFHPLGQTAS